MTRKHHDNTKDRMIELALQLADGKYSYAVVAKIAFGRAVNRAAISRVGNVARKLGMGLYKSRQGDPVEITRLREYMLRQQLPRLKVI